MAQTVTLSSSLPGEEVNGLKEHTKELLADPLKRRLVIAVVYVEQATRKFEKNVEQPRLKIAHIEVMSSRNAVAASKLLAKELSARTGADTLPFPEGSVVPLDFDGDEEFADTAGGDADARDDEGQAG